MRKILHIDLNNFYASVECVQNPTLRGKNVAVTGAEEDRHGIILAKSKEAKALGIKTGMTIWQAKKLAPDLITITANFPLYLKYSNIVRKVFEKYTDFIEPFGIDESWIDVTDSLKIFNSAKEIALKIIEEINKTTGLTVSIGISYNKVFAKLGSDLAGINEIIEIDENNFKSIVWPLPCENLLYVGKATKKKLNHFNIFTIGDLANYNKTLLEKKLGKWGGYLHDFANGKEASPVRQMQLMPPVKSVGNSMTNYKDITNEEELKVVLFLLSESVVSRLRDLGAISFSVIHVGITKTNLEVEHFQKKLNSPILSSTILAKEALKLLNKNFNFEIFIRAVSVSVSNINFVENEKQLEIFDNFKQQKLEKLEKVANKIQKKHGNTKFKKAIILEDDKLSNLDIKEEHIIHPESFF